MSEHAHEGLIRYGLSAVWTLGQRSVLGPARGGNLYKADDVDQALAARDAELEETLGQWAEERVAKDVRIAELERQLGDARDKKPADPPVTRGELLHVFSTLMDLTDASMGVRDTTEARAVTDRLWAGQDARGGETHD